MQGTADASGATGHGMPPLHSRALGFEGVAHDARSLATALGLYCDLLAEPGVLAAAHRHYLDELRLISAATRRLVEELGALSGFESVSDLGRDACAGSPPADAAPGKGTRDFAPLPAVPIGNLAAELRAGRNLLQAIAGAGIAVGMRIEGGNRAVQLTAEDLTRVLVNLVKNAAEAMEGSGAVDIALRERKGRNPRLVLTVEDSGPGVPEGMAETIFAPHVTSKTGGAHRGLGLAIVRCIVEAAGGRVRAANRASGGARFEIELPVRRR